VKVRRREEVAESAHVRVRGHHPRVVPPLCRGLGSGHGVGRALPLLSVPSVRRAMALFRDATMSSLLPFTPPLAFPPPPSALPRPTSLPTALPLCHLCYNTGRSCLWGCVLSPRGGLPGLSSREHSARLGRPCPPASPLPWAHPARPCPLRPSPSPGPAPGPGPSRLPPSAAASARWGAHRRRCRPRCPVDAAHGPWLHPRRTPLLTWGTDRGPTFNRAPWGVPQNTRWLYKTAEQCTHCVLSPGESCMLVGPLSAQPCYKLLLASSVPGFQLDRGGDLTDHGRWSGPEASAL